MSANDKELATIGLGANYSHIAIGSLKFICSSIEVNQDFYGCSIELRYQQIMTMGEAVRSNDLAFSTVPGLKPEDATAFLKATLDSIMAVNPVKPI